jgi:hypothetical protein
MNRVEQSPSQEADNHPAGEGNLCRVFLLNLLLVLIMSQLNPSHVTQHFFKIGL